VLTKPLGTGVLINAFKLGKIGEAELEPALAEMERLNARAAELALEHGARAATDITGFALAGHALNIARGSAVGLRIRFDRLPVHDGFFRLVRKGVSTLSTAANQRNTDGLYEEKTALSAEQRQLLFDPQTSGGLLICAPAERAGSLVEELVASGHQAAEVGEVLEGPPRLEVV
jgi:selenide,water dikinase